jgi:hypothetical protein
LILRLLIGTGLLLMFVGFGAAGWQYWQSLPAKAVSAATEAKVSRPSEPQRWLISPSGGLVSQEDVRAFLVQEQFVPGRTVEVIRQARLGDILDEGETLPAAAYHQVLADIRAPRVADGLCDLMTKVIASECALNSARVLKESVDQLTGTAKFRLELAYQVRADATELPDLAGQVLRTEAVQLDLETGAPGTESADAALSAAVTAAIAACAGEDGTRPFCRPMWFKLAWEPGHPVSIRAGIAWLDPLPEGMYVAPSLEPAPGG